MSLIPITSEVLENLDFAILTDTNINKSYIVFDTETKTDIFNFVYIQNPDIDDADISDTYILSYPMYYENDILHCQNERKFYIDFALLTATPI